jgi:glucose-6-phosphate 1-dehydrogenase
MTHETFRARISQDIKEFATSPVDPDLWDWFVKRLYYLPGDAQDPASYRQLHDLLAQIDQAHGTPGHYLFYLATAPTFFSGIIQQLGDAGLTWEENGH